MGDADARKVKRWPIAALVEAAMGRSVPKNKPPRAKPL
jgi:hypothetical protein